MQKTIEIARKLASLNQTANAQKAYMLALNEISEKNPDLEMEAASYIFFSQGNYQIAYTAFISLYNRGFFKEEIFNIMMQAFYLPNVEEQQKRYEQNCEILKDYPYIFRKDFIEFDELAILFFPFNEKGFIPYNKAQDKFENYVNFNDEVIDRYFFKDLENPILADDVYSQYQLEYLNDNVRKSEWVARENHIYLHYTNWNVFCAYLKCIDLKEILKDEKIVFLIEQEIKQYPIDFKEQFGIDYSKYNVKPFGINEVNRLIWHTQLSAHNGGDFFNEIFYGHPNLLIYDTIMMYDMKKQINRFRKDLKKANKSVFSKSYVANQLKMIKNPTNKEILVAMFLENEISSGHLDKKSRIAPAMFLQPHFHNLHYDMKIDKKSDKTMLEYKESEEIKDFDVLGDFKYIKAFTPMRRPTTSYAASIKFMVTDGSIEAEKDLRIADAMSMRILTRSYMLDPEDRLMHDSRLVRFEDGKLNPKATFTALSEFLDIPYTESMTYCSNYKEINPESYKGNVRGFDTATVYRTYDEYINDAEREFIEFCFRDAYEHYGYDMKNYHGEKVDKEWIDRITEKFICLNNHIRENWREAAKTNPEQVKVLDDNMQEVLHQLTYEENEELIDKILVVYTSNRREIGKILMRDLYFINKQGQPLKFMTPLKLDPELLEQPLYH